MTKGRRTFLTLVLVGAGWWGVSSWLRRPPRLVYRDLPDLPGFRMVAAGEISRGATDPFVGLGESRPSVPDMPTSRICAALFRDARPGTVPVAAFSDYFCPYCRVLTRDLAARAEAGEITVTWHELPLLGETSEAAARVALAADIQGGYPEVHALLMRSRVVATPAFAARIAEAAGLDPEQLARDADSAEVARRISTARSLARVFGFYGTPALVIGRTAVLGAVDARNLDRLIDAERDAPGAC